MRTHYWIIVVTDNKEVNVTGRKIAVKTGIDNAEELCYYACSVCVIDDEEYVCCHAEPSTKEEYEKYKELGLHTTEL